MTEKGATGKSETAKREEEVLQFWRENNIFEKSVSKDAPKGEFTFYEGPPTANGKPGIHHLEARAFKDAIPRYKTMQGYRVARRAGWDTHGLPVELEVEKQLGFSGKPDIEKYGIAAFNQKCRESVLQYIDLWGKFTERIGYWVDQSTAYFTFDAPYMESLWSIVKKVSDDGRLVKDYKVLPWCARCGTALSSHELAQGYEDVKDLSVTAKFKVKNPAAHNLPENTYLLAWTTTPWTLPGNVALAVGESIDYVLIELFEVSPKNGDFDGTILAGTEDVKKKLFKESLILAKERLSLLDKEYKIVSEMKGSQLLDIEYEPLFDIPELKSETSYKVYAANFVTTEDGTGIVHTAVMYGADDFTLGNEVGLPKVHTVGADGKFLPNTPEFLAGRFVKEETVAVDIIKDLAHRGLLFAKEKYEHSYPFCWRCKTPLIYYARDSWYIRMTDLRDTLLAENAKVHWEPEHIKEGRVGEWLSGVKDWAISRERYWGTPLPVWEAEDGEKIVVGSVEDLKKYAKKSGNTYFVMRHGESEANAKNIVNSDNAIHNPLTEKGRAEALVAAQSLQSFDLIVTSPILRAHETAEIVQKHLKLPDSALVVDERLREIGFGELNNGPREEFHRVFPTLESRFYNTSHGAESWKTARKRLGECLYDLENAYKGKHILIVAHDTPNFLIEIIARGETLEEAIKKHPAIREDFHFEPAEVRAVEFTPIPVNANYELDLHRPYIDEVILEKDGKEFRRVKEVMDVWFDSGAMPFAQDHYPFEKKEIAYPADYICEAIDQTRGWFYTLLAVGALMGRGAPYKNVISLGHLLDGEGKKMSKSRGNVVDPWIAMDQWGADALRFWMYNVNQPGDPKNFDDKTVREAARVISWLDNCAKFYDLFKDVEFVPGESQVIDQWIEARTSETIRTMTEALDGYRPYEATRSLTALIEDLSQWYVRRIRERTKDGDTAAVTTLRSTLKTCALLIAPFSPFVAEDVYRRVREDSDPESVHLAEWPEAEALSPERVTLMDQMRAIRSVVSKLLKRRQELNVSVRQPLQTAFVPEEYPKTLEIFVVDEVNVKEVVKSAVFDLDAVITPELKEEGVVRETIRAVQDARKKSGLKPGEKGGVTITVPPEDLEVVEKNLPAISAQTNTDIALS